VLGLVPAVPRFVLLHGFGRSYRCRRDACWRPDAKERRVQKRGHNEVVVAASTDAVWRVVIDVTRVGEWSHECTECSLLGDATRAEPGVRFRGRNRQGIFRWGRVCEVLAAEPPEFVWRTVPTTLYPDSTIWRIRVMPTDGGTRLEQSFEVVRSAKVLEMIYAVVVPAHRDRAAALTDDLRRLGALAPASHAGGRQSSLPSPTGLAWPPRDVSRSVKARVRSRGAWRALGRTTSPKHLGARRSRERWSGSGGIGPGERIG
jgi:hypothetical protein